MTSAATETLLDRDAELEALRRTLDGARDGQGRLVIVKGEAGIGKTALLDRVRGAAGDSGFTVLSAAGANLEREFAWGVARQLFEPLVYGATAARRRSLFRGAASLARPALGLSAAAGASRQLGDASFAANHGLYWLTANLADGTPAAMIVDDAHWADLASLLFLNYLGRRVRDLPIAVIVGMRSAEPGAPSELLEPLRAIAGSEVVEPSALSEAAVRVLIERRMHKPPGPQFLGACREVTGGNPFLLEELLRALGDAASPRDEEAAARARALGPSSIGHAVLGRLASMWPDALALARAVAILGADAGHRAAAALAGLEMDRAHEAADALVAAHVFAAAHRPLRFAHPILKQAVYSDIPPGRRSIEHRRAALMLEELGAPGERVAVHLLATDPTGDEVVVDRLQTAAERALARGAPEAALTLLERAVVESPRAARRPSLLLALGRAARGCGHLDQAATHLREALAVTGETTTREAISRELATTLTTAARPEEGLTVLEQAVAECPENEHERRLRLEGDLATLGITHDDLAHRSVDRAERIAAGLTGASPAERVLLGALAYWRGASATGSASDAARIAESALGGGMLLQEQTSDSFTYFWAVLVLLWADQDEAAERYWMQGMDDARARGSGTALFNASIAFGRLHMYRGEVADAEAAARLVEDLGSDVRYPYGAYTAAANLILPLVERGQLEEAESVLARYGRQVGAPPALATGQTMLSARIVLRTAQARHAEAAADAEELLRRHAVRGHAGLPHGAAIVRAQLAAGDRDGATRVARAQLAIAERWGATSFIGIAQRSLALAVSGAEGVGLLKASAARLEQTPCRLELARTLTCLGAALRRQNRRAEARDPLRRGLDLAARCHASALAREAQDELRACGARPRRLVLRGVESLTPTERRVAGLVADGLSNPDVAQTMFVTRATVETHLGAIYRKLDISSRSELPGALAENLKEPP